MKGSKEGKNISIYISGLNKIDELNAAAKKIKISRGKLVRNLVHTGIEEMTIQNNLGLIGFAIRLKKFKEHWSDFENAEKSEESQLKDTDKKEGVAITIWLSNDVITKMDYFTEKLGYKSRSELAERLINMGLSDIGIFEITGTLQLAVIIRDAWRKLFEEAEAVKKTGKIDLA